HGRDHSCGPPRREPRRRLGHACLAVEAATLREPGAIAQLGERLDRTQEVAGSSPASSTKKRPAQRAFLFSDLATESCENVPWSSFGQVAAKGLIAPRRSPVRVRLAPQAKRPAQRAFFCSLG